MIFYSVIASWCVPTWPVLSCILNKFRVGWTGFRSTVYFCPILIFYRLLCQVFEAIWFFRSIVPIFLQFFLVLHHILGGQCQSFNASSSWSVDDWHGLGRWLFADCCCWYRRDCWSGKFHFIFTLLSSSLYKWVSLSEKCFGSSWCALFVESRDFKTDSQFRTLLRTYFWWIFVFFRCMS